MHDRDYVAEHTVGFDELRGRLADYPLARVAAIAGLAEDEIVALARAYAATRPSVIRHGRGSVELRARVGDRVRPGVVTIWSGWWASLSPGGSSANVRTSDGTSEHGGADFHDTLVDVAAR